MNHLLLPPGARLLLGSNRRLLADGGSLTRALRRRHQGLRVVRATERLARRPQGPVLLRQVVLSGDGRAVLWAHSELPLVALRGRWLGLRRLGRRPLGDVLFAVPWVRRRDVALVRLGLPAMRRGLGSELAGKGLPGCRSLWGRRSTFYLGGHGITVTEILLPDPT